MTVLLTAFIIADHMVENNKYGERQSNIILHLSVWILSSSPPCAPARARGASFDQILQLGPLTLSRTFYNTAFGQRHNLRSSSCSTTGRLV